jgi:hypothetical protein
MSLTHAGLIIISCTNLTGSSLGKQSTAFALITFKTGRSLRQSPLAYSGQTREKIDSAGA